MSDVGKQHHLTRLALLQLALKIKKNCAIGIREGSLYSTFSENLLLVEEIFKIPEQIEGNIVEFGCFKGISSANLSLACKFVNRELLIFDSFHGLPKSDKIESLRTGKGIQYEIGDFSAEISEVKNNITRYGCMGVCKLIPGFFSDTLPKRPISEKYALIFEDADLPSSVTDVLENSWHRLQDNCKFFCHEAQDLDVVKIFFNDNFWEEKLKCKAPGLVGSGVGIPLRATKKWRQTDDATTLWTNSGSYIGYVIKKRT